MKTETEVKHSPTPWKSALTIENNNPKEFFTITGNAKKPNGFAVEVAHYVSRENAELIVRAVNAHAELVEAIQTVLNLRGASVTISDKLNAYLRDVLANAEGR